MVRKMNRISLYEAIQRKKEAQGHNTTPKAGSVPEQSQRTEPRVQLKQPQTQAKPAIPVKPVVKSPIKPLLAARSTLFRKEKKYSWGVLTSLKELIKNNPTTAWMGIGGFVVVSVLIIFLLGIQSRQNPDKPAKQVVIEDKTSQNKTQRIENIGEQQTQSVKPAVPKEEKPAAIVQRPVQAPPAEPVKPQAKTQLPPVIQDQLQKQADAEKAQPPKPVSTGDHIIVIAAYTKQDDLAPVGAYFRQNGIETEVIRQGSYCLLVTKQRFENPEKTGTDGFRMKQTIKRIGANYKAPSGYERFSSTPFQDAYGKKVK
jgi:hypothetical protein